MFYIIQNKVKKWGFRNEIFKGKIFINLINEINYKNEIYKKEMNTDFYDDLLDVFFLQNDLDIFVNNIKNIDIEYYIFQYGIVKALKEYNDKNEYIKKIELKNIFHFLLTSNICKI